MGVIEPSGALGIIVSGATLITTSSCGSILDANCIADAATAAGSIPRIAATAAWIPKLLRSP